jgi:hypothetical protein
MNKNQRTDVKISNSMRTKGPNASNTCTRVFRDSRRQSINVYPKIK